jgi:hypothetical protein
MPRPTVGACLTRFAALPLTLSLGFRALALFSACRSLSWTRVLRIAQIDALSGGNGSSTKKIYARGLDRAGRPIVWVRPALEVAAEPLASKQLQLAAALEEAMQIVVRQESLPYPTRLGIPHGMVPYCWP